MNKKLFLLASAGLLILAPAAHQLFGMDTNATKLANVFMQDKVKSDEDITKAVKDAFVADKDLSVAVSGVDVKTVGGVVTLSGSVDSAKTKSAFEAKAKSVAGVHSVVNNLKVSSTMMNVGK